MDKRLEGKIAIVVGAGQTPGDTIGNGRATAILFARHGARVLLVDRRLDSAEETRAMIEQEGGEARACAADITRAADCAALAQACLDAWGRIDILHNNVGTGEGDRSLLDLEEAAWERIFAVNLKGMFLTCKAVMPQMIRQKAGAIVNISSAAAVSATRMLAYRTSKAGVNAFTQSVAMRAARHGIRVNAIMPGLINTPMAIEGFSAARGKSKAEVIEERNRRVPLGGRMGEAWDVAHAALFLASDEAKFITGVILPVDGGQTALVG
ncbi:MAG: SDR family oxidoreductase [Candidatus Lambdaproteobacteria bacterium]|nr:SDR family oxidoreductase [Candidatus Lambdaproteobacteria bacterium]